MAKVGLKIQPKGNLLKDLGNLIATKFGAKARNSAADFRPIVESAIIQGVSDNKSEFIPSTLEAYELGIGDGGNVDTSRTHGAWEQLLPQNPLKITTFSIVKNTTKLNFLKRLKIFNLSVNVDEEKLYEAELSRIPTPDSNVIDEIEWMRWMIQGSPVVGKRFLRTNKAVTSRTGGGIMVKGGLWEFEPTHNFAFDNLIEGIESNIVKAVRRDIGKVL